MSRARPRASLSGASARTRAPVVLARGTNAERMANIRELFAGARAPPRTGETPRGAPRAGDEVDDSVEKDGHREDVDDDARATVERDVDGKRVVSR